MYTDHAVYTHSVGIHWQPLGGYGEGMELTAEECGELESQVTARVDLSAVSRIHHRYV